MQNFGKQYVFETKKRSLFWLRSGQGIQLVLFVHEIVQDKLFDAIADGVHAAGVFHRIAAFEVLRDAFNLCVLPDHQIVGFLRIAVQIG